jgi:hypothetical protein
MKKIVFIFSAIIFTISLYAQGIQVTATSAVSEIDSVLKLLDDKTEPEIKKGIERLKEKPELSMNDDVREKICRIYAENPDKYGDISKILLDTRERRKKKTNIKISMKEQDVNDIVDKLQSKNRNTFKAGFEQLNLKEKVNSNMALRNEGVKVILDQRVVSVIGKYFDDNKRDTAYDDVMSKLLRKYDYNLYTEKIPVMLSTGSKTIKMRIILSIEDDKKLLRTYSKDLLRACANSDDSEFKYAVTRALKSLNDENINYEMSINSDSLIDVTNIILNVLNAYKQKNAVILFKNSDSQNFLVINSSMLTSREYLYPKVKDSTLGSCGTTSDAMMFLTGQNCLSVENNNDIKLKDNRVIATDKNKYYINIIKSSVQYTGHYFKSTYFDTGYIKRADLCFCINFELMSEIPKNQTDSCENEKLGAIVLVKDSVPILAGVIGLKNYMEY